MAGRRGREVYRRRAWARLRRATLNAVNWRCEQCGAWTREVHHRVPLSAGGDPLPGLDGVQALCIACHQREHGKGIDRRAWLALFARALRED